MYFLKSYVKPKFLSKSFLKHSGTASFLPWPNPSLFKNLGEKADEVYPPRGVHGLSWSPTALHPLGPRSTSNQCIMVRCEYLSHRKTPKKPLNQSERPPLAVFLVTIFRQFNAGQSPAPLAARCYCWQHDGLQLPH